MGAFFAQVECWWLFILTNMRLEYGQLKKIIRESACDFLNEDLWAEAFSKQLHDDPSLDDKETVWIERDSKKKIKKWMKAMGLA